MAVVDSAVTRRPLRIAVCISHFHPTVGGAERQMFQLAACWARQGRMPIVITRRLSGQPAQEFISGVEIRRTIVTLSRGPLFGLSFLASLSASLLRFASRFDVVLAAQAPWEAVAAGLMAPALGKPSLVRLASVGPRGDVAQLRRAKGAGVWRSLALRNGLFLAPSPAAWQELADWGCPPEQIRPFTNGVDTQRFHPPSGLSLAEAAERDKTAIFVGRLSEEKNPRAALRAWKLLNCGGEYRLLMAGDGPQAEALAAYARQESLNGVEFLGQRSDMPELYRKAAVCLQPSPHEGCSNALLEAMASGVCPVVASAAGNLELVEHEANGLAVSVGDVRALSAALARALQDSALRRRLSEAARRRAVERHDLERIAAEYVQLFESLLQSRSNRGQPQVLDKSRR